MSSPDRRWAAVGAAVRTRRLARDLTLVELAARSELSQPFLSQIENGRARPSMQSLYRIASALDTTPQALFTTDDGPDRRVIARSAGGDVAEVATDGESLRRLLLPGDSPFHVVELVGLSIEYLEPWQHEGTEAIYVLAGPVEIDLDGETIELHAGDFLTYAAVLPHRYRSSVGPAARVLLIESQTHGGDGGTHSA